MPESTRTNLTPLTTQINSLNEKEDLRAAASILGKACRSKGMTQSEWGNAFNNPDQKVVSEK